MPRRTKAIDITGHWVNMGDKIVRYERISSGSLCSRCNGEDKNCDVCGGIHVKDTQFKLVKWLKNLLVKK